MLPCVHLNAAKGYNATFTVDVSLRAVPGKAGRPVGSALICPNNSAGASQLIAAHNKRFSFDAPLGVEG
jgi:hypothetical protein